MTLFPGSARLVAILLVATLALPAGGCAHVSTGESVRDVAAVEQNIRDLHDQWAAARVAGDVAFLERFYAREFRVQSATGALVDRAQDIAVFDRAGKDPSQVIVPEYIHDDEMTVSLYGDTAVVTGVENLRGRAMGVYGEMALRFTNVLELRDGRWQLVLHHSTRIP